MPSYSRKVEIPGKNADQIYEAVSRDIDKFLSKSAIGNYDVTRSSRDKVVSVSAKLFSAELTSGDNVLHLDVKLSLIAAPFKSKLDQGIDRWLAKTFGL